MAWKRLQQLDYPQLLFGLLLVATMLGIIAASTTSGATFGLYNPTWEGTADLRASAHRLDVEQRPFTRTAKYGEIPSDDSVVFILAPEQEYTRAEIAQIRSFVRRGGTVVVADDVSNRVNPLLAGIGAEARIDGRLLRDERYNYQSSALPIARNVSDDPLVAGIEQLTLNYGTPVRANTATVLVSSSSVSYIDANRNGSVDANETLASYPVVTAEAIGAGRVIVVGDPSIFINSMLGQPDNRAFAERLMRGHERVYLDYSHAGALPPLTAAVLWLRDAVIFQFIVGIIGIGSIAVVFEYRDWIMKHIESMRRHELPDQTAQPDRADLIAFVQNRHPDWEEERIERVIEGIMKQQEKGQHDG